MIRLVTFNDHGDILLQGELGTDTVKHGVVLLTKEQAAQAAEWGWYPDGDAPSETVPPLYRVRR